ncbi:MAG: GMC family oxidoreductase [Chloroflexota bacterium]|nr:GMC family oxidoreductase [Chloroflexota bacterium]
MDSTHRKRLEDPDVLIVGAGAAGGVLAKQLAEAGLKVVVLEAGPHWVPERDFVSDERAARQLYWTDRRITAGEDPIELAGNVTGKGVGGSTVHYAMVALRMHEDDFRTRAADGVGEDWPISYEDLEPYYEQIGRELGISGPVRWPWKPELRGPYPYREHPLNATAQLFARGCDQLGVTWAPAPLATISAPKDGRHPCVYRGYCVLGCSTNAKSSTLVTHIPKALAAGAEIRPDCMAARINLDSRGRARSVSYFRPDGTGGYVEEEQRARVIIVSCYSIETPRLLLNSACSQFPDGLANSSGLVGTHLMIHSAHIVFGRFEELVRQYKAPPCLALTQDFYETDWRNDYARGYTIECVGPFPIQFAKLATSSQRMWGERLRNLMMDYNHYAGIALNGECLPYPENTVTVVADEKDQYGLPIPKVTFSWGENERRMIRAGVERMRRILDAGGAQYTFSADDTAHLMGACRMGSSPRDSVVDPWCRSWDVPNLFICDGSVLVTSSGVNPSLTIQAIAARTTEHIIEVGKRQEL